VSGAIFLALTRQTGRTVLTTIILKNAALQIVRFGVPILCLDSLLRREDCAMSQSCTVL
jgi:hypothetical protein